VFEGMVMLVQRLPGHGAYEAGSGAVGEGEGGGEVIKRGETDGALSVLSAAVLIALSGQR
jgi:hypothetical protein